MLDILYSAKKIGMALHPSTYFVSQRYTTFHKKLQCKLEGVSP